MDCYHKRLIKGVLWHLPWWFAVWGMKAEKSFLFVALLFHETNLFANGTFLLQGGGAFRYICIRKNEYLVWTWKHEFRKLQYHVYNEDFLI